MYCKPSVMPCILICSVFLLLIIPRHFSHLVLAYQIKRSYQTQILSLGLGFSTRALASSCHESLILPFTTQKMLLFSDLPHRIYISKIKWVEQWSLLIQLS